MPYIIALLNCLLFTWYGLPVVSNKWENLPLVTVNGVGILFELSYVLIYFWFSTPKGKVICIHALTPSFKTKFFSPCMHKKKILLNFTSFSKSKSKDSYPSNISDTCMESFHHILNFFQKHREWSNINSSYQKSLVESSGVQFLR